MVGKSVGKDTGDTSAYGISLRDLMVPGVVQTKSGMKCSYCGAEWRTVREMVQRSVTGKLYHIQCSNCKKPGPTLGVA